MGEQTKPESFTQSKLNNKSKQYFVQKFTKEIIMAWQGIPEKLLREDERLNETMTFEVMQYVLT